MSEKQFNIGEVVTWESQAGGSYKSKTGKVIAIIPSKARVRDHVPPPYSLDDVKGFGFDRRGISYLVEVQETLRSKPRLYWPNVGGLKSANRIDPLTAALQTLELIANTGMDARQCAEAARSTLSQLIAQ